MIRRAPDPGVGGGCHREDQFMGGALRLDTVGPARGRRRSRSSRNVRRRRPQWLEVVEGFPYSGVYVGLDNVLHDFFGRLFQDFEGFVAVGSEFLRVPRPRHRPRHLLRSSDSYRKGFHRPIRSCLDPAKRQDRPVAAVRRYGAGYSCNWSDRFRWRREPTEQPNLRQSR
jgi:hypothetical protein